MTTPWAGPAAFSSLACAMAVGQSVFLRLQGLSDLKQTNRQTTKFSSKQDTGNTPMCGVAKCGKPWLPQGIVILGYVLLLYVFLYFHIFLPKACMVLKSD